MSVVRRWLWLVEGLLGLGGEGGCPSSPGGIVVSRWMLLVALALFESACSCNLLQFLSSFCACLLCLSPFNLQQLVGAIGEVQVNDLSGLCCFVKPVVIQASPGALPGHWPHFIAIVSLLGVDVVWMILLNGSGVLLGFVVAALFSVVRLGVPEHGCVVCCSRLAGNFSWPWEAQLGGPLHPT